ncbi:MAG TPA: hypothetical protein VFO76_08410 [Candidatus Kapabacteria bacterium]|nr:hypothetical protein [Candidatus Kapabacteria bacterium]
MRIRTHISKQVIAIAALLLAFGLSSCGEVSLNDPMLGKELVHTIFYVKRTGSGPSSTSQILRINADGTNPMVIADDAYLTSGPRNGKVVYFSPKTGKDVYVILCNADGSDKIIIDSGAYIAAELSPKADFVILTTEERPVSGGGRIDGVIYRVDIGENTIGPFVKFIHKKLEHDICPILSPNGKSAAFFTDGNGGGYNDELTIVDTKPGDTGVLRAFVDIGFGEHITWSADASNILIYNPTKKLVTIPMPIGSPSIISFPQNWKVEDAIFSAMPDTILASISTPSSQTAFYEVNSSFSSTPTPIFSNPGKGVIFSGYSTDRKYILYTSQLQTPARSMKVYDRFLQKDTVLDTGVNQCFFAK